MSCILNTVVKQKR